MRAPARHLAIRLSLFFYRAHQFAVKRALLQTLKGRLVHDIFYLHAFHLGIGDGEQPLHVLDTGRGRLDVEAVQPLKGRVAGLGIVEIIEPQIFCQSPDHDLFVGRFLDERYGVGEVSSRF